MTHTHPIPIACSRSFTNITNCAQASTVAFLLRQVSLDCYMLRM